MESNLSEFSARAAAVFGGMGTDPPTTLNYNPSKSGTADLSENTEKIPENDDEICGRSDPPPSLLSWRSVVESDRGKNSDEIFQEPSAAFRQAFEDEPDEDEFDFFAAETLRKESGARGIMPPKHTEVVIHDLENEFEGGPSTSPVQQKPTETARGKGKKRVSFSVEEIGEKKWEKNKRPSPRGGRRRSYVPHHVKHPEKYTCYVLDEPITVGSGKVNDMDDKDMKKALEFVPLKREMEIDPNEEDRFIPEFGSGIEFRPSGSKKTEKATHPDINEKINMQNKFQEELEEIGDDLMSIKKSDIKKSDIKKSDIKKSENSSEGFRHRRGGNRKYRSSKKP